jgi:hypothetical protein
MTLLSPLVGVWEPATLVAEGPQTNPESPLGLSGHIPAMPSDFTYVPPALLRFFSVSQGRPESPLGLLGLIAANGLWRGMSQTTINLKRFQSFSVPKTFPVYLCSTCSAFFPLFLPLLPLSFFYCLLLPSLSPPCLLLFSCAMSAISMAPCRSLGAGPPLGGRRTSFSRSCKHHRSLRRARSDCRGH